MKKTLLIFIALVAMGSGLRKEAYMDRWVVEKSSSLQIEGSSNVNEFRCDITEYINSDTLCYVKDAGTNRLQFANSCVSLDVYRFDCHQKYITHDLRKTLKAEQYPVLKIHFLNMESFKPQGDNYHINGTLDIALAGKVKRTQIQFLVNKTAANGLKLTGSKNLKFSDFGLTPPKKLAGLIRIHEDIKVNFRLIVKTL